MALARYGYSVGCGTSLPSGLTAGAAALAGAGLVPPKRGWDELRSAPGGPPGYPETGEEVSKPLNWAEVYI